MRLKGAVVMITGAKTTLSDVEVLRKPFDLSDLIATVNRYCGAGPR